MLKPHWRVCVVMLAIVLSAGACQTPGPSLVPRATATSSGVTPTPTIATPTRTLRPVIDIPTPEKIPAPEPTATPRPTAEEVTAEIVRARCEKWRPLVEATYELYPVDSDLVLAVMAQESACLSTATDGTSVGLMQVTPKTWTPSEAHLYVPRINVEWGMYLLYWAINHAEHNPEKDVFRGVAAYNCGWISLDAGKCLWFGGPTYARRVLDFWLPYFEGE